MINPNGTQSESNSAPNIGEIFGIPSKPEKKIAPHFNPEIHERRSFARQVVHEQANPVVPENRFEQAETLGQIDAARIMGERLVHARQHEMQPNILHPDFVSVDQMPQQIGDEYELAA